MGCEYVLLNGEPGLLVAQKLRDQRQVQPLAGRRTAVEQLGSQLPAQRAKITAVERHLRKPGHADAVCAADAAGVGQFERLSLHMAAPPIPSRLHAQAAALSWRRRLRCDRAHAADSVARPLRQATTSR